MEKILLVKRLLLKNLITFQVVEDTSFFDIRQFNSVLRNMTSVFLIISKF